MDKANGKPLGPVGVYREMFKAQPQLSRLLALQSLVLMLGRGCVALAAWAVAWAVDSTLASQGAEQAAVAGAAAIGALYAGTKALEWALSCLHSRLHAAWVLPCAFGFCDKAMAAALEGPLDRGADPAELAKRLDKKAEARAALGFLFHHIAPPIFELCLCAATLAWMGFGWLGWALIPAAAAHVWLAVSLSPKIKARVAQALRGAEKSQSMVAQATESAALARAYGSQSVLSEMMERRSEQERSSFKSQALASDAALSAQSLALAIYGAAFFWAGLSMASSGQVSAGAFAALVGVSAALFGQLKTLAFAFDGILSSTGGLESLAQALRSSPEREAFRATGPQPPGELALHGWSVSVGGQGILAIDQLRLGAGEKLYLVGASGAGKTSLALSLLGQRESSGAMSWAGKPWEPGRPGVCAHVPQDRSVIAGSARDNLRLGDPSACDERMWAALRQAKLAETVEALGGLDAEIAWRGSSLSGGQAQRLALARALLSGMPLLLLDEPTSGLDAIAESQILAEISALKDRSAIVCAHRIRAIPKGSRVALLSGGSIAEQGALEDLISTGGEFAKLWEASQAR